MANKYKKIKIKASNGLSLRNGPNLLGDIVGIVLNDAEYEVANVVPNGHLVWGYLVEANGWVLLENTKTGDVNVIEITPPRKKKRRQIKKVEVQVEVSPPEEIQEDLPQDLPSEDEAKEIADEEN